MEIKIFTKETADKSVYFSYNDNDYLMNFDNLVILSKKIIEDKTINLSEEFNVSADSSLDLYKTTLEKIINDVLTDEELLQLLTESKKNPNVH
jgi:hypothetical protein